MRKIMAYLCVGAALSFGAACDEDSGDDGPDTFDAAPMADAAGGGADAGPGTVSVHVVDRFGGAVVEGATVVVHTPDGTVKASVLTNAMGDATAPVDPGDMVTTAYSLASKGTYYTLHTVAGVQPGDELIVGPRLEGQQMSLGTLAITTPGDFAGATGYRASAGNDVQTFSAPPIAAVVNANLFNIGRTDLTKTPVLLLAEDSVGPAAYAVNAAVPIAAAGGGAAVTFAAWRTDFHPFTSRVDGLFGIPTSAFETVLAGPGGETFRFAGNNAASVGSGPTSSADFSLPMDLATRWAHLVTVSDGSGGDRMLVAAGVWPIADLTRTLDTDFPANIDSVDLDTTTPARPVMDLTRDADGVETHDAVLFGFGWSTGGSFYEWLAVTPPGTTSFTFPALPASLADFVYTPSASIDGYGAATFDADGVDYDDLRAIISFFPSFEAEDLAGYLGAAPAGTLRAAFRRAFIAG